jgi:hypothetical protein
VTDRKSKTRLKFSSAPLVTHMYTADPSAHNFEGKLFIYPSHDIEAGVAFNDNGDHFCMEDYHVFSMESAADEIEKGVHRFIRGQAFDKRRHVLGQTTPTPNTRSVVPLVLPRYPKRYVPA